MPADGKFGYAHQYLLPLELGSAIRGVRDEELQSRLLCYTVPNNPSDEVDLVLLACAAACLQDGSEEAAAYLARKQLSRHPDQVGLAELGQESNVSDEVLRARVDRYLTSVGYSPGGPVASFHAIGDIYLGRVHRSITHPILGSGCVAYFSTVALAHPETAVTASDCGRLWSEWTNRRRNLEAIEQEALDVASEWVTNRENEMHRPPAMGPK